MIKWTEELRWRKAKRCTGGNCVEVATADDHVLVRNSSDLNAGILRFTHDEWRAFVGGVKDGEFSFE